MKVSVVVLVHNEAKGISRYIENLIPMLESHRETGDFEIVIVDDNGSDGSPALVDSMVSEDTRVVPINMRDDPGFGNAVRSGLKKATGDAIVITDMSADPDDIHSLVAKIEEGCDIAYGSRFCKGGSADGYPEGKLVANRLFNNSVRLLFGTGHRDTSNVFKAYRKAVLDGIGIDRLEAAGPDIAIEIPLKAHILGFKSAEVPVSWRERKHENVNFDFYRNGYHYGKRLLKLFIAGNLVSLKDIWRAVMRGSPVFMIIASLLGLVLLAGVFSVAGFTRVLSVLSQISPAYLLISCAMVLTTFAIRAWRGSALLKALGYNVRPAAVIKCYFFGFFINFLLPAAIGDFMRALSLKATEDVPFSICLPAFVIEGAMDMLTLAAILVTSLVVISGNGALYEWAGVALLLALGLVVGLLVLYRSDHLAHRILRRFKPLQKGIGSFKNGLGLMLKAPATIAFCLILTLAVWLFEISSIYFASRAVHLDLPVALTLVTGATSFIAEAVPLTPAGLGIHEGAIAGVLYLFGIDVSMGTSVALLDHFARGLVIYICGIISTIHIGFGSRRYFALNDRPTNADRRELS